MSRVIKFRALDKHLTGVAATQSGHLDQRDRTRQKYMTGKRKVSCPYCGMVAVVRTETKHYGREYSGRLVFVSGLRDALARLEECDK